MKRIIHFALLLVSVGGGLTSSLNAQSVATVRVPMCLQFPDSHTYVPCTGVIPVDLTTGNALDWNAVFRGTPSGPVYTQETTRRTHWSETVTPLAANALFNGVSHDDGGNANGGSTRSTSFSCFSLSDQAGTLNIQGSDDSSTWITFQSRPMVAMVGLYLIQPLFTRYWRCQIVNGSTNQSTLVVKSAFGM